MDDQCPMIYSSNWFFAYSVRLGIDFAVGSNLVHVAEIYVPSGSQTWRAGKWTIETSDFPIKTSNQGHFPASHVWLPEGTSSIIFLAFSPHANMQPVSRRSISVPQLSKRSGHASLISRICDSGHFIMVRGMRTARICLQAEIVQGRHFTHMHIYIYTIHCNI